MESTGSRELVITNDALKYAKIIAARINSQQQRKRAFASIVALDALADYLLLQDIEVSITKNLFKIAPVNEEFEIADIYYNNWKIDVRVIVDDEFITIPKAHFTYDIVADFYVGIKVDKNLEKAEFVGFIEGKNIDKTISSDKYYLMSPSVLSSFDEFVELLAQNHSRTADESGHEQFRSFYLSYLDGDIEYISKKNMIKHLINCAECRADFVEFYDFEAIVCNAQNNPEIFDDHTLDILGGTIIDDEKYQGKEELIDIRNLDSKSNDVLDNLFESDSDTKNSLISLVDDKNSVAETEINSESSDIESEEIQSDIISLDDLDELFADTEIESSAENNAEETENFEIADEITEIQEVPMLSSEDEGFDLLEEIEKPAEDITETDIVLDDSASEDHEDMFELVDEIKPLNDTLEELSDKTDALDLNQEIMELSLAEDLQVKDSENELVDNNLPEISSENDSDADILQFSDDEASPVQEDVPFLNDTQEDLVQIDDSSDMGLLSDDNDITPLMTEDIPDFVDENETIMDVSGLDDADASDINGTIEDLDLSNIKSDIDLDTNDNVYTAEYESEEDSEPLDNGEEQENQILEDAKQKYQEMFEYDGEPTIKQEIPSFESEEDGNIEGLTEENSAFEDFIDSGRQMKVEESNFVNTEDNQISLSDDDLQNEEINTLYDEDAENIIKSEKEENLAEFINKPDNILDFKSKKMKTLAAYVVGCVVIACLLGASLFKMNKNKAEKFNAQIAGQMQEPINADGDALQMPQEIMPPNGEDIARTATANVHKDMNKVMTNVFDENPSTVAVTKIAWEVSQGLASNEIFTKYLQIAGKNLQLNLKNDLINATEFAYNDKIKVSIEIGKDNKIKNMEVISSSGSEQIDNIVLQSIKETLKYINVPQLPEGDENQLPTEGKLPLVNKDVYNLKIVINF